MVAVYYNEWEAYPARWLRNLIAAGHLPPGDVDERDIREIQADDIKGYTQCHFFAGIGGWPLALQLAGWPSDEPVWTGSCPCQPLSSAGQRKGHADERHLWPAFYSLIAERKPPTVFGEQVAGKLGCEWLAGVRADLEDAGYAVGAADLPAACVGSPNIRQRLWWVADAERDAPEPGGLADQPTEGPGAPQAGAHAQSGRRGLLGGVGDTDAAGLQARQCEALERTRWRQEGGAALQSGGSSNFWAAFDLTPCADGKARRIEPGTFPLAHGVPARVGKLRAYGNAIVPQVAAEFVMAYRECRP